MKWSVGSLIFAFCLTCSVTGEASYVIKLKNGNTFITGRYWYEGKQVMFDAYGGVFGVDKTFVMKIEQSNETVILPAAAHDVPEEKPQVDRTKEKNESDKPFTPAEGKAEAKREENDPILKDFYALKEKSKDFQGMLTSELQEFDKELTKFKKRVWESRRFDAYTKELNEAEEFGDAMEAILKTRR